MRIALVFAANGDALRSSMQFLILTNLLIKWLGDRIDVEQVDVASDPGDEETVLITINYAVKGSSRARSADDCSSDHAATTLRSSVRTPF